MKISSRLFMRKQRFHSLTSVCSRTEREEFQWKNIFFLKTLSKSWKKYMIQLNSLQWCSFLWRGHLEENPYEIYPCTLCACSLSCCNCFCFNWFNFHWFNLIWFNSIWKHINWFNINRKHKQRCCWSTSKDMLNWSCLWWLTISLIQPHNKTVGHDPSVFPLYMACPILQRKHIWYLYQPRELPKAAVHWLWYIVNPSDRGWSKESFVSLSHWENSIFSPFPHMKSHSFLSTFIRYAFTALVTLYIVYWLADFHINDLPWFTLQEWFMIAGEALVFCVFILAFKDTRK